MISRVRPSTSRMLGRVAWKSKNSSASIVAKRLAPSARAEEGERAGGGVAGVVPALERAHQRGGAKAVRTVLPAQRLHPIHRTSHGAASAVRRARHDRTDAASPIADPARVAARRRRGRRCLRLHAQGPPDRPHGRAVPRARAARPHRRDPGARVPRRRPARPAASSAASSCASPAASSASATSCRSTSARSRAREARRSGRLPARRLPRPRRARRLPRAPRARGLRPRATRALLDALLADARAARRLAPRPVHARAATTPTSAGCSSTRSRWRTLALEVCQLHPRLNSRPAAVRRARARPRQDARVHLRRRDRAHRGGPAARPRRARPAAASASAPRAWSPSAGSRCEHCVLCHHGADAAPGRRFGSAEALALYRLNALDASVKGALEHGLP